MLQNTSEKQNQAMVPREVQSPRCDFTKAGEGQGVAESLSVCYFRHRAYKPLVFLLLF